MLGVGVVQTRGGIEDAERVPDDDDADEKKRERDVGFDSIQILEHKEFFSIEREQHSSHLCACTHAALKQSPSSDHCCALRALYRRPA